MHLILHIILFLYLLLVGHIIVLIYLLLLILVLLMHHIIIILIFIQIVHGLINWFVMKEHFIHLFTIFRHFICIYRLLWWYIIWARFRRLRFLNVIIHHYIYNLFIAIFALTHIEYIIYFLRVLVVWYHVLNELYFVWSFHGIHFLNISIVNFLRTLIGIDRLFFILYLPAIEIHLVVWVTVIVQMTLRHLIKILLLLTLDLTL